MNDDTRPELSAVRQRGPATRVVPVKLKLDISLLYSGQSHIHAIFKVETNGSGFGGFVGGRPWITAEGSQTLVLFGSPNFYANHFGLRIERERLGSGENKACQECEAEGEGTRQRRAALSWYADFPWHLSLPFFHRSTLPAPVDRRSHRTSSAANESKASHCRSAEHALRTVCQSAPFAAHLLIRCALRIHLRPSLALYSFESCCGPLCTATVNIKSASSVGSRPHDVGEADLIHALNNSPSRARTAEKSASRRRWSNIPDTACRAASSALWVLRRTRSGRSRVRGTYYRMQDSDRFDFRLTHR